MRSVAPRTLLFAGVLATALSLSACSGDSVPERAPGAEKAPSPVQALPSQIAPLVTGTDVGQYFVKPKPGMGKAEVDGAIAQLKSLKGVQSAELNSQGLVDVQFRGGVTPKQREAAVKQMAALGEVTEGV